MKNCITCDDLLPLRSFPIREKTKRGNECKKCHNNRRSRNRRNLKQRAINYKGGCCQRCGFDEHQNVLQFHHRNPEEKDMDWSTMRTWRWESILEELDKCDLLCANCHIIVHAEIYENPA